MNNKYKNIIDIRDYSSYIKGKILDAKYINKYLLLNKPEKYLNKNDDYYIYCEKGKQSRSVCLKLRLLGYKVKHISGGYSSYLDYINK